MEQQEPQKEEYATCLKCQRCWIHDSISIIIPIWLNGVMTQVDPTANGHPKKRYGFCCECYDASRNMWLDDEHNLPKHHIPLQLRAHSVITWGQGPKSEPIFRYPAFWKKYKEAVINWMNAIHYDLGSENSFVKAPFEVIKLLLNQLDLLEDSRKFLFAHNTIQHKPILLSKAYESVSGEHTCIICDLPLEKEMSKKGDFGPTCSIECSLVKADQAFMDLNFGKKNAPMEEPEENEDCSFEVEIPKPTHVPTFNMWKVHPPSGPRY